METLANGSSPFRRAEFWMVMALLAGLVVMVAAIFLVTSRVGDLPNGSAAEAIMTHRKDVFEHRKDLLAIILGAFGAWIGAGAAYFFGRENLREATSGMLAMRASSPQERLAQTSLGDLKPKPMPITFEAKDTIEKAIEWLEGEPERCFVTIVDNSRRVEYVVAEEAIYRYIKSQGDYESAKGKKIDDVINYIKAQKDTNKQKPDAVKSLNNLIEYAIQLEVNQSCLLADRLMREENKLVTIVLDTNRTPIGYITTTDINRFLLAS
jgi:hypothetical protein